MHSGEMTVDKATLKIKDLRNLAAIALSSQGLDHPEAVVVAALITANRRVARPSHPGETFFFIKARRFQTKTRTPRAWGKLSCGAVDRLARMVQIWQLLWPILSLCGGSYILVVSAFTVPPVNKRASDVHWKIPPITFLALADCFFSVFYMTYYIVPGNSKWCRVQNFFFQFGASSIWLWTNIIAATTVSKLLRLKKARRWLQSFRHVSWLIAAASASPNLLAGHSQVDKDGSGFCDNSWIVSNVVSTSLFCLCFGWNFVVYLRGLVQASKFSPYCVLERYWRRLVWYLSIFSICWFPYVLWNVHEILRHHMPESKKTHGRGVNALFDIAGVVEASQGMLNALVYGYFTGDISQRWHLPLQRLQSLCCCGICAKESHDADASSGVKGEGYHTAFLEQVQVLECEEEEAYRSSESSQSSSISSPRQMEHPPRPTLKVPTTPKQTKPKPGAGSTDAYSESDDECDAEDGNGNNYSGELYHIALRSPLTEMPGTDDRLSSIMPIVLCILLTMTTAILLLVWGIHGT